MSVLRMSDSPARRRLRCQATIRRISFYSARDPRCTCTRHAVCPHCLGLLTEAA